MVETFGIVWVLGGFWDGKCGDKWGELRMGRCSLLVGLRSGVDVEGVLVDTMAVPGVMYLTRGGCLLTSGPASHWRKRQIEMGL